MSGEVFSLNIVWYLFLAGAGSGAFVLAAVLNLISQKTTNDVVRDYSQLAQGGLLFGPLLVVTGALFLLFDLGLPQKAYALLFSPHLTVISVGTWLIAIFCVTAALFLLVRANSGFSIPRAIPTILEALACLCAIGIMLYTGILFATLRALPFLNTPLVVALFTLSALASGSAVIALYGFLSQKKKSVLYAMHFLPKLDIVLAVCEALVLGAMMLTLQRTGSVAQQVSAELSLQTLLTGDLAPLFWLGVIGAGLVLPTLISIFSNILTYPPALAATALLVLVGAFALRYCLLTATHHINPSLYL
jgi:formate-dependent nitrite reductase membrane component NrfD